MVAYTARAATPNLSIWQVFGARIGTDGTLVDSEPEGLLFHAEGTAGSVGVVSSATQSLAVWTDVRFGGPFAHALVARRLLQKEPGPEFLPVEIGSIGDRGVAEGGRLALRLLASGLDPATVSFSASNLPPGASFDAANGLFVWQPRSDEAGAYPGVHFEATDGTATVSEDLTVTATEARLAIEGSVRLADGTPVPGVALALSGTRPRRKFFSDANGSFRVDVPGPGRYRIGVVRPSRAQYRMPNGRLVVEVNATDVHNADLLVEPK
ncbi:MAG: hypothetical protein KatS3mg076_2400 [Candidatus Binatia bacterium]|nr:MAG: hypothetical protein KatS3mg076_2400 [Candidatus Binatia bacterium]